MHELSIAQQIVEVAEHQLRSVGGTQVRSISLEIGVMSGVVKECLEFVFPEACRQTPLECCKLKIDTVGIKMQCKSCSSQAASDEVELVCAKCGSTQVEITAGKELRIIKMEIQ